MAAENWTAQLHIADGVASEDAPEIAYAERSDDRGRSAALYILAEPDRPGSEPYIGDLVSRIGEEFLEAEGSLTGSLQRVIRDRHEELLDWNRTSLPRDQASYGLSCLLIRDGDVFLMQMGPCLAYYRRDGRLLRRRPTAEGAQGPLGGADTSAPEFSQLQLGSEDWVLLISSEVARSVGEEAIASLRDTPVEDVLPRLYPQLRALARVSALVVAPGGTRRDVAPEPSPLIDEEPPLPAPGIQSAPAPPSSPTQTEPKTGPVPDAELAYAVPEPAAPPGSTTAQPALEEPSSGPTSADLELDAGPPPEAHPYTETGPYPEAEAPENDDFPERTSLAAAVGGFFSGLAGVFKRRPAPGGDPWAEAARDADFEDHEAHGQDSAGDTAPGDRAAGWSPGPGSDTELAHPNAIDDDDPRGEAGAVQDLSAETMLEAAAAAPPPHGDPPLAGEPTVERGIVVGEPEEIVNEPPIAPITPIGSDAPPAADAGAQPDSADHNDPQLDNPPAPDATSAGTREETSTGSARSVEYRFEQDAAGPGALATQVAGWPSNPFTPPSAPVLETGEDADRAHFPRHIFPLEGRMPRFRALRRSKTGEESDDPVALRWGWGALALAVLAVVGILAVVVGVLLVPDLLENSEQSRFEDLLQDTRRGLTAATLTADADAGRGALTAAQTTVLAALDLRPLDESALALQQEVSTALSQINAVVRPPDLVEVTNLAGRVPPPLALSLVQVGNASLFLLDLSGARVFSLPLAGGEPEVIFEAGQSYPLLFLFDGPQAGAPVGMDWAVGAAGASLTILDSNGRLFRHLPGVGTNALEVPNRELIGSPDAVAVDETSVYVLDVAGGIIWRFPQLSDGTLIPPQPAIARTDLSSAGSLAVSESLFVAGADGRIRRFQDGVDQGFPLLDLDRPLLVPDSLAIGALSGLIYTVDRGNNRVAVFSASGALVAQLRADELAGVRGVVPDEASNRIYYVTADALLTSTLPPIIANE